MTHARQPTSQIRPGSDPWFCETQDDWVCVLIVCGFCFCRVVEKQSMSYADENDSDNDEVEFLLTIQAPSPAKKNSQTVTPLPSAPRSTDMPPTETLKLATDEDTNQVTKTTNRSDMETDGEGLEAEDENEDLKRNLWSQSRSSSRLSQDAKSTLPNSQSKQSKKKSQMSSFPPRQSAYLQSLAEICHDILWDARWRTRHRHNRLERLLAWERGDDLSVVHAFSRRYLPIPQKPVRIQDCTCIFCYNDVKSPAKASKIQNNDNITKKSHSPSSTTSVDHQEEIELLDEEMDSEEEEQEAYDRALNLYARMYFRKGPWFRIDDLFKYYVPKRRPPPAAAPSNASEVATPGPKAPKTPRSPSKFFLPKSSSSKSSTTSENSNQTRNTLPKKQHLDNYIDQDYVNDQLEGVSLLLQDVQKLVRIGFVRSFVNEQECGRTVGQVQKYGLLRQEEQRRILAMLGGNSKKRSPRGSTNASATGSTNRQSNSGENLIWKQMCQQQSILAQASKSQHPSSNIMLPVAKHVDHALIASWANSLVLRASKVEYIPQGVLRSVTAPLQAILQDLLRDFVSDCRKGSGSHHDFIGISNLCWRLREAPLKALRRSCRLYLCATMGPGQMRGDTGTTAWMSLPQELDWKASDSPAFTNDMSGSEELPPTKVVYPPGSQCWNNIVYPGKDYRLKLISCPFQRAFQPLSLNENDDYNADIESPGGVQKSEKLGPRAQIFSSLAAFELWECTVDLRATVDYLLEANDLFLYTERKKARETEKEELTLTPSDADEDSTQDDLELRSSVDFLDILSKSGRRCLLERFVSGMDLSLDYFEKLQQNVEEDIAILFRPAQDSDPTKSELQTDCERVLACLGVLAYHILSIRNQNASLEDINRVTKKPWLRHLWWEGCLAYLLWDIIPILERRGYYALAIRALEVLLFGNPLPRSTSSSIVPKSLVSSNDLEGASSLAKVFLSRRARGKAYERLIIDYVHILRQEHKEATRLAMEMDAKETENEDGPKKKKRRRVKKKENPSLPNANEICGKLCQDLLNDCVPSGQITFCAARTLARRLKQPLSETLNNLRIFEVNELGHRLSSEEHDDATTAIDTPKGKSTTKYSDWTPKTDYAVAHAMAHDGNSVGGRCSYVGFEERQSTSASFGSLNVEELALEYYHTGRLPQESEEGLKGGWIGWHDEGGKLRALFRILSSGTVLGMDWGCSQEDTNNDDPTIFLTPYQGAPFDLHVGAERSGADGFSGRLGFYQRRSLTVCRFLESLVELSPSQLADLVWRCIDSRREYVIESGCNDPTLARDILQARTLSAMAAAFGGKLLAAAFRCCFFDYRHYSGGLPDLTLFRAIYEADETNESESLVDLGEWLGESFSPTNVADQEAQRVARMFEDQDEEFLGCSKVGDSGARNSNRFSRGSRSSYSQQQQQKEGVTSAPNVMPERVLFECNGRRIRVETMLVEVKSSNDRLDARQEDWLNILDRFGNARVCKFGDKKSQKSPKEKQSNAVQNM